MASIKQEAYNDFGKILGQGGKEISRDEREEGLNEHPLVFGYDKNYNVVGIATSKEQLKEILKSRGTAGVILNDDFKCSKGYDFLKEEQYDGLERKHESVSDYVAKQGATVLQDVTDVETAYENNVEFTSKLLDLCIEMGLDTATTWRPTVGSEQPMDELDFGINGLHVKVSAFYTTIKTDTDFLVIHDSNRDIKSKWYVIMMSRVLGVSEDKMKEVCSDIF
ncbi:hypothetical protein COF68_06125 [Bacillus toyonensis]|uniref:hypothetical protein n=1 Tax=Bacillus toyonensis TaxID=155322 RepID=UPI000BFD2809|nr:hypothetical protein [Bacillus toyonensis]PHE64411.1 hypothetical protein COF68_06125 [Bacillus toyonensis]